MKKLTALVIAAALLLSLTACAGKINSAIEKASEIGDIIDNDKETDAPEAEVIDSENAVEPSDEETTALPEGDKKDPYYWAEYFGTNVCPFSIKTGDSEKDYCFRDGGSFKSWLNTEMNTDGFYCYNDRVISRDGKFATEPDFDDAFSSCCTYELLPYDGPALSEEELASTAKGTVYAKNSWSPLCFGRSLWNYIFIEGENQPVEDKEFSFEGLRADFDDQEWINIYIAERISEEKELLAERAKLYVFPHKDINEYGDVITEADAELAITSSDYIVKSSENAPDSEEPIFNFYIPNFYNDEPFEGDADLIFTYDGIITYYITVTANLAG